MPSICNGSATMPVSNSALTETDAPCSKLMITYLEKRTRNLDKRKAKLDGYLQKEKDGEKLDKDQKEALKNLPVVVGMIECLKETTDHIIKSISEEEKKLEKQQRKQAKRQQVESHKQMINVFVQLLKTQKSLELLTDKSVTDRVLAVEDLNKLNLLKQMVSLQNKDKTDIIVPLEEDVENLINYLQGKDGLFGDCSFKEFREVLTKLEDSAAASQDVWRPEQQEIHETAVVRDEAVVQEIELAKPLTKEMSEDFNTSTSTPPMFHEATTAHQMVVNGKSYAQSSDDQSASEPVPIQSRAVKEPQEILSAVRGSYNFLQDSEIEEPQNDMKGCSFGTYDPYVPLPSGYSVTPSLVPDSHQLLVQPQPVSFSGHLLTLPYPQNLVNESIYLAHGLPVSFNNSMAISTPYTMNDTYSQPIISNELSNMMVPTTAYYDMASSMVVGQQHDVDEPVNYDPLQSEAVQTETVTEVDEVQEEAEVAPDAAGNEPEKKKFSMNPNADVFRMKNYPDGEADSVENLQGGYGGRRNGRGGRGGRGPHSGYQGRGGGYRGYGGRGGSGGYPRYQRDFRQEGQGGSYSGDYNGWQNGSRRDRGGRGGNPRGPSGRGHGVYDRSGPQNVAAETQE